MGHWRDRITEAMLQAMREELERRTREQADAIFGTTASGPRPSFKERDFGRWADKVRGEPGGDDADAFYVWRTAMDERTRGAATAWTHFELPPEFLAESPSRSDSSSFKESFGDAGVHYGGTPCEAFAKRGSRSIFLSRAYLAVSEEPAVAIAAVAFRAARELERRHFWKVGADGKRVYAAEWFEQDGPERLKRAEAKLRRRIRRALIETTPSAEPSLW